MKNLVFLLFLVLLCNCKKENTDPDCGTNSIVDSEKVWYISESPNPCPGCIWPHKITFGKDTTINSFVYKEVLDFRGEELESESKAYNLGYLRETADKKVYWNISLFGRPAEDILIYDFNAQVNDTIDKFWIVTDIETVEIQGIERKKISLINCASNETHWIEGIGDLTDLLYYTSRPICGFDSEIVGMSVGGSWYTLNCVEKNSSLIYKNTESNDCWMYKGYEQ